MARYRASGPPPVDRSPRTPARASSRYASSSPGRVTPRTTRMMAICAPSSGSTSTATGSTSGGPPGDPGRTPGSFSVIADPASTAACIVASDDQTVATSRAPSCPGPMRPPIAARRPGTAASSGARASRRAASKPAPAASKRTRRRTDWLTAPPLDVPAAVRHPHGRRAVRMRPARAACDRTGSIGGSSTAPNLRGRQECSHDCDPHGHHAASHLPRRPMGRVGRPARRDEPRPARRAGRVHVPRDDRPVRGGRRGRRPRVRGHAQAPGLRARPRSCARSPRASGRAARSWARRSRPRPASRSATPWSRWTGRR